MAEGIKYAVVGAGRQGTAAAYDLIMHGGGASVALADADGEVARRAATRINSLVGRDVATGVALDVRDYDALVEFLQPMDTLPVRGALPLHSRLHPGGDPRPDAHGRPGWPYPDRAGPDGPRRRRQRTRRDDRARLRHGAGPQQYNGSLCGGSAGGGRRDPARGAHLGRRAAGRSAGAVGLPVLVPHQRADQRILRQGRLFAGWQDHRGRDLHRDGDRRVRGCRQAGSLRLLRRDVHCPVQLRGQVRDLREQDLPLSRPFRPVQGLQGPGPVRGGPSGGHPRHRAHQPT